MSNEIAKIRDVAESQLKKTDKIIASHEAVENMISEVNDTLAIGFTKLGAGLQELCFVANDGFREIADRLELQSNALDKIKEILERPLDTQARELRKRAEVAYLNNWIEEAEMDLLDAEKKNYQDFIVHQILGNIYYYHKKNYPKAIESYQKAAKYAAPVSKKHASNALICAANGFDHLGQLSDAYKSADVAIQLLPDDPHNLYQHARYAAKSGHKDKFVDSLKKSIIQDPDYLIAAYNDDMFAREKTDVIKIAEALRSAEMKAVDDLLGKIDTASEEAESMGLHESSSLEDEVTEIKRICSLNSYNDFLQAKEKARNVLDKSVSQWEALKRKTLDELLTKKGEIQDKTYACWGFLFGIITAIMDFMIIKPNMSKSPGPVDAFGAVILPIVVGIASTIIIKKIVTIQQII